VVDREQSWLVALQRGLPLAREPFAELAVELGCCADDLIEFVSRCRAKGVVRRFGGVFDVRRLGYRSALCSVRVPAHKLDAVASKLVPRPGVTHCYVRECAGADFPNLWFTLSEPSEAFDSAVESVRADIGGFCVLPAVRRFKVDVVFGGATRARDESVGPGMPLSETDRAIVRALQGDTEVRADYFAAIADRVGLREWDLLSTLEMWRRSGRLKRVGLLLAHRAAGWTANGMCCWRVGENSVEKGRLLAECDEVTHCYERPLSDEFPFNLFAMVHARERAEAEAAFARLESACGLSGGVMLVSTREYKKTSMMFFDR